MLEPGCKKNHRPRQHRSIYSYRDFLTNYSLITDLIPTNWQAHISYRLYSHKFHSNYSWLPARQQMCACGLLSLMTGTHQVVFTPPGRGRQELNPRGFLFSTCTARHEMLQGHRFWVVHYHRILNRSEIRCMLFYGVYNVWYNLYSRYSCICVCVCVLSLHPLHRQRPAKGQLLKLRPQNIGI